MIKKVQCFRPPLLTTLLSRKCSVCKLSTNVPQYHYDIIIAGGGLVGTTLACTLGNNS